MTCGEPAGIGPEVALRAAAALSPELIPILIGDFAQLQALARELLPACSVERIGPTELAKAEFRPAGSCLWVCDVALPVALRPGHLDARNGPAVLRMLDVAIDAALGGAVDAMVTAPIQKSTINDAGIPFSGHTEYLAERTSTEQVVMMLAGGEPLMRVALATTHLPLRAVADALSVDGLLRTLDIIHRDLRQRFGIARPRILVAGLNPHAGEGGYLGREEIDIISPALDRARAAGIDVQGPLPADTLFQPKYLSQADCVLTMYHDQGLPVLKFASFGHGVNITLGLPLIRTSVDHGTAIDLAAQGTGRADDGSMRVAMRIAAQMAHFSRAHP